MATPLVGVKGQTITTFPGTPREIFAMSIDEVDEILSELGLSTAGILQENIDRILVMGA